MGQKQQSLLRNNIDSKRPEDRSIKSRLRSAFLALPQTVKLLKEGKGLQVYPTPPATFKRASPAHGHQRRVAPDTGAQRDLLSH